MAVLMDCSVTGGGPCLGLPGILPSTQPLTVPTLASSSIIVNVTEKQKPLHYSVSGFQITEALERMTDELCSLQVWKNTGIQCDRLLLLTISDSYLLISYYKQNRVEELDKCFSIYWTIPLCYFCTCFVL